MYTINNVDARKFCKSVATLYNVQASEKLARCLPCAHLFCRVHSETDKLLKKGYGEKNSARDGGRYAAYKYVKN